MKQLLLLPPLLAIAACASDPDCDPKYIFSAERQLTRFFRGNTHTHTERSYDSDEPITNVLNWYKGAGYGFVVLTDHDVSADPSAYYGSMVSDTFLAIAGEEISSNSTDRFGNQLPIHVNSICSNGTTVPPTSFSTPRVTLRDTVQRVVATSNGVAQINHPNYFYALTASDIAFADGARLIEIANQHKDANNAGDAMHPSVETIWDDVLSAGHLLYGVASDDSHAVSPKSWSPPGRGWVAVATPVLTPAAVCASLVSGDFYASTGVEIGAIRVTDSTISLTIIPSPGTNPADYETKFIGHSGVLLSTLSGLTPTFKLNGERGYVRAKVSYQNARAAWIQPQTLTLSCAPQA